MSDKNLYTVDDLKIQMKKIRNLLMKCEKLVISRPYEYEHNHFMLIQELALYFFMLDKMIIKRKQILYESVNAIKEMLHERILKVYDVYKDKKCKIYGFREINTSSELPHGIKKIKDVSLLFRRYSF